MGNENSKMQNIAYSLVSVICLTVILTYTKTIMIPFVLALFIAMIARPTIEFLSVKLKIPNWLSILIIAGGLILFLGLVALLITSSVGSALGNIEEYKKRILEIAAEGIALLGNFGIEYNLPEKQQLIDSLRNMSLFKYLSGTAGKMVTVVSDFVLVFLFVVFLLSGHKSGIANKTVFQEIDKKIRVYLLTKVSTSLVTGVLTAGILALLGLDMAIMFGVLAYLLNFIPTVGSLVATIIPLPVALLQFPEYWKVALVIALPGAIQFLVGNIIEPKFLGDSLDLHPITIMLALMFFGLMWGVVGMILAAPLAVIIKILFDQSPNGKFFSELMAGRI